jgi:hypothetical protein
MMDDRIVILPSTGSIMGEMLLVVTLFVVFCIYVSYLAAYNTGFRPNYVMFINFLFDDYSGTKSFEKHIKNIVADEKESFTNMKTSITSIKSYFNMLISKLFIKGNRFTIMRR